jgi:hypothetical protein
MVILHSPQEAVLPVVRERGCGKAIVIVALASPKTGSAPADREKRRGREG